MMGMHASFTISDETMEYCAANKPDSVGYHIHVAEGIEDLQDCLKTYGKRTVERLLDLSILGPKTLAVHCIYINDREMDILKETDTMVVHNPESNMGNACGCPPTMEIVRRGILTGLGTDGYTHDMIESYKVANILHKHHLHDATAAWTEVPKMLFEGNAQIAARYFKRPLGILKPGASADVIVLDYDPITPMDETNCNGHILFGMTGRSVITTVCNGRVLMKERAFTSIDEEKVCADVRESASMLWKNING
jgi:putative selenium metabolism protein SsnA